MQRTQRPTILAKVLRARAGQATAQRARRRLKIRDVRQTPAYKRAEAKVRAEMEDCRKHNESSLGSAWTFAFFNNFRLYLPGNDFQHTRINERKRGKTRAQFLSEVNSVIKQFGINANELASLQTKRILERKGWDAQNLTHEQYREMDAATTKQFEIALPIYIELRRRGYSHKDLVS